MNTETIANTEAARPFVVGAEFTGNFYFGKNGIGFVRVDLHEQSIEIPGHATGRALHRDTVQVAITSIDDTSGAIGKVLAVSNRSQHGYMGILQHMGSAWFVTPYDRYNSHIEIHLDETVVDTTKVGERVFVTITGWSNSHPTGEIEAYLGAAKDHKGFIEGLALEKGFSEEFPEDVEAEAQAWADELNKNGYSTEGRIDLRDTLTFTIDPDDAKDFDDAISYKDVENGMIEVGVHIADVSHYVRRGTALDDAAHSRATSVYLVDRTIPMLPEVLSNHLCSLRPDEEKYAFSALFYVNKTTFEIDDSKTKYSKSLIKSNKRFTYDEAHGVITETAEGPYKKELQWCDAFAKHLKKERFANGALSLEKDEVRFILDEKGDPIDVRVKTRHDTHKMIEELMLLANRYVATFLSSRTTPGIMVYRVHDEPDFERTNGLKMTLKSFGYEPPMDNGVIPLPYLTQLVDEAENDDLKDILSLAIARSMQKAIYQPENIGHYGLGFEFYSHFTSPIRRYPDLMLHRILQHVLTTKQAPTLKDVGDIRAACIQSTEQEKAAMQAERNSDDYMQARYLELHQHETFKGMVTSITKRGMFVVEHFSKADGRVALHDMIDDFMTYDEERNIIVGKHTGTTFKMGDHVTFVIKEVNVQERRVDFALCDEDGKLLKPERNNFGHKRRGGNHKNKKRHNRD